MEPFHVILHCIADFYRVSYKDAPIFNIYVASPGQRSYDISYHMVRIRAGGWGLNAILSVSMCIEYGSSSGNSIVD